MARSLQRISRELVARRSAAKRALAENGDSNRATAVTGNATGRASKCEPYRELIEAKLEPWLDAGRIREDLIKDRGFAASYSSIQRFVNALKSASPKKAWGMEVEPGEEAQVEHGKMLLIEGEDGRVLCGQPLRVTLSHSRRSYGEVMPSHDAESFIWGSRTLPALRRRSPSPVPTQSDGGDSEDRLAPPRGRPQAAGLRRPLRLLDHAHATYSPQHHGKVERGIHGLKYELKDRRFASVESESDKDHMNETTRGKLSRLRLSAWPHRGTTSSLSIPVGRARRARAALDRTAGQVRRLSRDQDAGGLRLHLQSIH